jgi:hypothetical protein
MAGFCGYLPALELRVEPRGVHDSCSDENIEKHSVQQMPQEMRTDRQCRAHFGI